MKNNWFTQTFRIILSVTFAFAQAGTGLAAGPVHPSKQGPVYALDYEEPTDTPTPTVTATPTETATPLAAPTNAATATPSGDPTETATPWVAPTNAATATPSGDPTETATPVPAVCVSQGQIPAAECDALTALYTSTNGANWIDNTGWLQTDTPCSWFGVSCVGGHVTQLQMSSNNLSGVIPGQLGSLTNLTHLYLNSNQLTGSISPELGTLTNLTELDLNDNQLSGSIPSELGNLTQLHNLSLNNNQLSGEIPASFTNFTSLEELAFDCGLTSSDPVVIAFLNEKSPSWSCNPSFTPRMIADPVRNWVRALGWPNGTLLTLTVDDPSNGVGVDKTINATMGPNDGDPNDIVADFELGSFDIQSGQIVKITDGNTDDHYAIASLAITGFDLDADTISGIATPGVEVEIGVNMTENNVSRYVTPDATGHWTADFGHPGDRDPDLVDLRPRIGGWVAESDANGNQTWADWRVLNPHIKASPGSDWVQAQNWPSGTPVTLTIDDLSNGVGVDKTVHATMGLPGASGGDPNDIVADFNLDGFDLQPGDILKVTDGTTERTYTPLNLVITGFDLDADKISGIATPGMEVQVCANDVSENCVWRYVTSDGTGNWIADYGHPGARDDEQQLLDLQPGNDGWATESDANENQTWTDWRAPSASIPITRAFYLKASADANWIHAYGWQNSTQLTLTVDRPLVGGDVDYTTTATAKQAFWDPTPPDIAGVFDLGGAYNLQPGDKLTVSGAGHTETYTVPASMTQVRWFTTGNAPGQLPAEFSVVDDYNQSHPNVELIVDIEAPYSGDPLTDQINAGHAPDIAGPTGWAGSSPFHGKWLDLTQLIQDSGFDTSVFTPALVSMYHTDEGQVALPFAVYPSALYYNPALFDAAGLHYPPAHYGDQYKMPDGTMATWSWDTLTQVAKLLTRDSSGKNASQSGFDRAHIVQYGFSFGYESNPNYWGSFWQSGSLLQGSAGNYSTQIPDAWRATWSWVYDGMWGNQPYIPNGTVSNSADFGSGNVFDSGKVAMLDNPAWYTCCVNNLINAGGTFQFGAMPSYNGQVAGRIDADTFRILKDSAYPEQAFDVLSYLVTSGVDKLILGTNDLHPAYGSAISALQDKQQASLTGKTSQFPFVTQDSWNVLLDGLNYPDSPSAESWMPNFNQAWNELGGFAGKLSNSSGLNLDDEIAQLQADLQDIFKYGRVLNPNVRASPVGHYASGGGWPTDTNVHMTITRSGTPTYQADAVSRPADFDSNKTTADFDLWNPQYDIQPGDVITMSGADISRSMTVSALRVTGLSVATNTVWGTADAADGEVHVWINDGPESMVPVDSSGNWTKDFSPYNLSVGVHGGAEQTDANGNQTGAEWTVNNPNLNVFVTQDRIEAHDWPDGDVLTLNIYHPGNAGSPSYTTTRSMGPAPWNPSEIVAVFDLQGIYHYQVGDLITVSDGALTKTHTVLNVNVTAIDVEAGTISGTSDPAAEVQIETHQGGNANYRRVTADSNGDWSADFSVAWGDQGTYELTPGLNGSAIRYDNDGDVSRADWHVLDHTPTATETLTPIISETVMPTTTKTETPTITRTPTATETLTPTITETVTPTPSATNTPPGTATPTKTLALTPTVTAIITSTATHPILTSTSTPTPILMPITTFVVVTAAAEVYPGDPISVDLNIQGASNLYAAQADCAADAAVIRPQDAAFGNFFDPVNRLFGANIVNTVAGTWTGAISQRSPALPLAGNGLFATIHYLAQAPGSASIACDVVLSDPDGFTQPVTFTGANVTVLPFAIVNGVVKYQGRTVHSSITVSGPIPPVVNPDGAGNFTLNMKSGAFAVTASASGYLSNGTTVNAVNGATTTLPTTILRGGDANNDHVINIGDATLVAANFGKTVPPGDARADINGDGKVNIQDLAILGSNYGLAGTQPW